MLPAAIAGRTAGSGPGSWATGIVSVSPRTAAGERNGGDMGNDVKENDYGDVDIEKLKYALQGLNSFYLALVWEFAEFLLRIQTSLEEYEAAKKN
ncbi:hypothetical protein ES708_29944 [subsurface metagenome]